MINWLLLIELNGGGDLSFVLRGFMWSVFALLLECIFFVLWETMDFYQTKAGRIFLNMWMRRISIIELIINGQKMSNFSSSFPCQIETSHVQTLLLLILPIRWQLILRYKFPAKVLIHFVWQSQSRNLWPRLYNIMIENIIKIYSKGQIFILTQQKKNLNKIAKWSQYLSQKDSGAG